MSEFDTDEIRSIVLGSDSATIDTLAAFERWLRSVRETAWDQGYVQGTQDGGSNPTPWLSNPYREAGDGRR